MAKNGVYHLPPGLLLGLDSNIKQSALMFDRIYIPKWESWRIPEDNKLYEYLVEKNVIAPFAIEKTEYAEFGLLFIKEMSGLDENSFDEFLKTPIAMPASSEVRHQDLSQMQVDVNEVTDQLTRANATFLRKKSGQEFYPVLRTLNSFRQGRKEQVVQLLLNEMPEVTIDTPWEAILDLRRDELLREKYLSLVNWINEISYSSLSLNELQEGGRCGDT